MSERKSFHPFTSGQVVLKAGGPYQGIACLQSGRLAVIVGRREDEAVITPGVPGEAFGLRDWKVSPTNTREVVGIESGHYCFIPTDELGTLCAEDPSLMACVFGHLCRGILSVEKSAEEKGKKGRAERSSTDTDGDMEPVVVPR